MDGKLVFRLKTPIPGQITFLIIHLFVECLVAKTFTGFTNTLSVNSTWVAMVGIEPPTLAVFTALL